MITGIDLFGKILFGERAFPFDLCCRETQLISWLGCQGAEPALGGAASAGSSLRIGMRRTVMDGGEDYPVDRRGYFLKGRSFFAWLWRWDNGKGRKV